MDESVFGTSVFGTPLDEDETLNSTAVDANQFQLGGVNPALVPTDQLGALPVKPNAFQQPISILGAAQQAPQAQATQLPADVSSFQLGGVNPMLVPTDQAGQLPATVNPFQQTTDAILGAAQQAPIEQGLTTVSGIPLGQFLSGAALPGQGIGSAGGLTDAQGRIGAGDISRSLEYQQDSVARQARLNARPDFNRAISDRERRGTGEMSKSDAVRMAGGDRNLADAMIMRQRQGRDAITGQLLDSRNAEEIEAARLANIAAQKTIDQLDKTPEEIEAERLANIAAGLANKKTQQDIDLANQPPVEKPSDILARDRLELDREQFEHKKNKGEPLSASEEKVNQIMEATGVPFEDASNIVTGVSKIQQNPITGNASIINIATGESTPIRGFNEVSTPDFDVSAPPPGKSLYELAGATTGAIEEAKRLGQKITGQFGLDIATDASIEAKQTFQSAQNDLIRAFREGGRFTQSETELLRQELDISPSAFLDEKTFLGRLRSIDKSLEGRYKNAIRAYKDTSFPADIRQDAQVKAAAIAEFRAMLGLDRANQSNAATPPEGISPEAAEVWSYMTTEEQQSFIKQ